MFFLKNLFRFPKTLTSVWVSPDSSRILVGAAVAAAASLLGNSGFSSSRLQILQTPRNIYIKQTEHTVRGLMVELSRNRYQRDKRVHIRSESLNIKTAKSFLHIQVFHVILCDQFCYIGFLNIWEQIPLQRTHSERHETNFSTSLSNNQVVKIHRATVFVILTTPVMRARTRDR